MLTNCAFVSLESACLAIPTFFAIRRKDAIFVVGLNNFSKSERDIGDFLSIKNDLSELIMSGGKGNLPSWIVE